MELLQELESYWNPLIKLHHFPDSLFELCYFIFYSCSVCLLADDNHAHITVCGWCQAHSKTQVFRWEEAFGSVWFFSCWEVHWTRGTVKVTVSLTVGNICDLLFPITESISFKIALWRQVWECHIVLGFKYKHLVMLILPIANTFFSSNYKTISFTWFKRQFYQMLMKLRRIF